MKGNLEQGANWIKSGKIIFWRIVEANTKDRIYQYPSDAEEEKPKEIFKTWKKSNYDIGCAYETWWIQQKIL